MQEGARHRRRLRAPDLGGPVLGICWRLESRASSRAGRGSQLTAVTPWSLLEIWSPRQNPARCCGCDCGRESTRRSAFPQGGQSASAICLLLLAAVCTSVLQIKWELLRLVLFYILPPPLPVCSEWNAPSHTVGGALHYWQGGEWDTAT